MFRCALGLVVGFALAGPPVAQQPKWEPPPTPEGWKAVVSKDGSYRFVVPQTTGRSGTRERTRTTRGTRIRTQTNYYTLKDGTTLEVEVLTLTGAGTRGVTVTGVIDGILAGLREEGYKVSDPKEAKVGDLPAREVRLTKGNDTLRAVLFGVKPRIFVLNVIATDPAKVDGEMANTFLRSLVMVPSEVVRAQAKDRAAKQEVAGKANQEKYGAKWTMALKDMTPPDAPVIGLIRGQELQPDVIVLEPGGRLKFSKGTGFFAEVEASLTLFLKPGESLANKKYEVAPTVAAPAGTPHIHIATLGKGAKIPKTESFINRYALILSFGAKDAQGDIPGTIYLCTPDVGRSFLAGKFTVRELK
jgi:hypothetical protein